MYDRPENPKTQATVLVIVTGMVLLGIWFESRYFNYAALLFGVAGLSSSLVRKGIHHGWHKLAAILGYLNGRILLTIIFYLVLTPLGLLQRLLTGKGKIIRHKKTDTYYMERNHTFIARDLENPW